MKRAFFALAFGCIVWAISALADPARVATVLCYLQSDQNRAEGISVTRTATGTYLLSVGGRPWGLDGYGQISPYGSGLDTLCHVGDWSADITALFPICQTICP